ncbi:MAG: aminotransferase class IV, partial [Actinobacteria bacterium]|nr:aminotransferase class IV [Actinomycetota bacterium]
QTEGLLKGVVCDYLLKNNLKGITFKEAPITLPEIFKADEVFVTNSLIGALPVVQIDEHYFERKTIANLVRDFLWEKFAEADNF